MASISSVGSSERTSLKDDVTKAKSVMRSISSLDMSVQCRNYFNKNNATLNRIYNQINNSGGCYIATMVYGDYDHPQVMVLRNFRDTYLAKRDWGKRFIRFYYKHSPGWVERLKNHKRINQAIKLILDSFVSFWKKASHYE